MWAWISRLFRSRLETLAEKAEVDGRYDEAARLYVECGARAEAFRVLLRAAESARQLADRRGYLTRAYGVARSDELRALAKKRLASVTLAECESSAPRDEEERQRLAEAATDLEAAGSHREAARAFKILGDRDGVERMHMLSGDLESFEREVGADATAERLRLRRRNAIESFQMLWLSGDRLRALAALDEWLAGNDDAELRALRDERLAAVVNVGRFEARLDGVNHVVVGTLPVTFGREGTVVVRGASVSREHCVIDAAGDDGELAVRDNGSRNGTQIMGLPLAGSVALAAGSTVGLGADLALRVSAVGPDVGVLEVERGMDRGKRVVLVRRAWETPLGVVRFERRCASLVPRAPVKLGGQRVAAAIILAHGDRIESDAGVLEVL
jgi:hypothetical protein